ncbi:alpha/beta hydrolase [Candidatus Paracaedibacter symbiosus]|uniref:alpha/beta hydrolase n=1 Tax=Candidatus Paracaedibacter symbiosus TaxID=244582 RepID=UPI000509B825|nr:dienelactone hydrolase family protein [Candidatus Paracaedibacter symbiosus]
MLSGPQKKSKSGVSPKKLVVLLHGYGANGDNLIDLADMWAASLPDVEFHAPNAHEPCESVPFGYQWFGLTDFNPFNMRAGLERAAPILCEYLEHLLRSRDLTSSDLSLVGFSQGTMLALEMLFHLPGLKAVLGYSGAFYPPLSAPEAGVSKAEVLLVHGTADMVVPYAMMGESANQLHHLGFTPKTHTCHGLGHSIDLEGISLGGQFLGQVFSSIQNT